MNAPEKGVAAVQRTAVKVFGCSSLQAGLQEGSFGHLCSVQQSPCLSFLLILSPPWMVLGTQGLVVKIDTVI